MGNIEEIAKSMACETIMLSLMDLKFCQNVIGKIPMTDVEFKKEFELFEKAKREEIAQIKRKIENKKLLKKAIDKKFSFQQMLVENAFEAIHWFNERLTTPFGYGWCLEQSGMNPNDVRIGINRYIKAK